MFFTTLYYIMHIFLVLALFSQSGQCSAATPFDETCSTETISESDSSVLLEKNDSGTLIALKTPIIHFSGTADKNESTRIDLIGAIHFADPAYYEHLNRLFSQYELVLVEMVLPEKVQLADLSQKSRNNEPITTSPLSLFAQFQERTGSLLGLADQLEAIDYSAKNFLVADLNSEELAALIAKNREIEHFVFESLITLISSSEGESGGEIIAAAAILLSGNRRLALRRYFASLLAESLEEPPLFEKTLIQERNRVVIEKLTDALAAGNRRIAIFYGAAHLPDLSRRLTADFPLSETGRDWLTAWSLQVEK